MCARVCGHLLHKWPSCWPGSPGMGPCQAQPDKGQAGMTRRASRAVPNWAPCLTNGPSIACRAAFRAVPAREARSIRACHACPRPTRERRAAAVEGS
jgi:hypothetical protein